MRLVRCHIDNFGVFTNFDYEFDARLNVINEHNGFGKSTLCDFIKAMFYGLSKTKSKQLAENPRVKYNPWQGGTFGGSIEFYVDETLYKIERVFGLKSSEDVFRLYDLTMGRQSFDFTENIGEEIFGIDAKGFERCTLINASHTSLPSSVSARLCELIDDTDDMNNYEEVYSRLLKESRKYSTTGKRGLIHETKQEIAQSAYLIDLTKKANEDLKLEQSRLEKLLETKESVAKELENIRLAISQEASTSVIKEKIKHYNMLVQEYKNAKLICDEIVEKYVEIPTQEQIEDYSKKLDRLQLIELEKAKKMSKLNLALLCSTAFVSAILFTFGVLFYKPLLFGAVFFGFAALIWGSIEIALKYSLKASFENEENYIFECLEAFKNKHNIITEDNYFDVLQTVKKDVETYKLTVNKYEDYQASAKDYYKTERLKSLKDILSSKTPVQLKFDEKEILEKLDLISEKIIECRAKINQFSLTCEQADALTHNYEQQVKKLDSLNEKYSAILQAMSYLEKAKDNLSGRYKGKAQNSFKQMLTMFKDSLKLDVMLDNDLAISVIDNGSVRELESYSTGIKSLIESALKISVCKTLFEKESAFIILDDPFVALDEETFSGVSKVLNELSKETQIIYFTCTDARML